MKIAVMGTGQVGMPLGLGWAKAGHDVVFGVQHPADELFKNQLSKTGLKLSALSLKEAAAFGEVIVLAIPWLAAEEVLRAAGNLANKIIIDPINPIQEGLKGLSVGLTTSAAEKVAQWAPKARVVKAFNAIATANLNNPTIKGKSLTLFLCGDDPSAKKVTARLGEDLGFEICDCGPLHVARYLEPMAMLLVHLAAIEKKGADIAFKLLMR
ncbi:MAG: NADPH-dependent F420 reductase [Elusimicrobia bacterium]|nr:NADPH-dependent F420 reductase [Candidatus Obscuribacterium magneticum]